MQVEGQIALITGGASGMGRATARLLAGHGMRVVVWDRLMSSDDFLALSLTCDVSSESSVEHALSQTIDHVGIPRVVVNCAGVAPAQKMVGKEGVMPLAKFKEVIDINLVGTFNVMRLLANAMGQLDYHDTERGIIINTASVAAFEGQIGQTAYSASKGGLVSMTLPAARELAYLAIRVNTIAPGLVATPMLLSMPQEVQDSLAQSVTFPKRLAKPEEFASLVLHLVQNEYINGEVIRIDGAIRMQAR